MKRGQTATEYIIIVAVVIVIAVVVASVLGGFPGIGSGTTKKIDDFKLSTSKVAVDEYGSFEAEGYSLIKIRNNHFDTLVANKIYVNRVLCQEQNITLNTGQSTVVNCSIVISDTPNVEIIWTEVATDASYTEISGPTLPEDTTAPTVSLNTPANKYTSDSLGGFIPIDFNCSTTDDMGLSTLEIVITDTSNEESWTLYYNGSKSVSGTSDSAKWTLTPTDNPGVGPATYTWNCKATDLVGNSNWASSNYTFTVEPELFMPPPPG